MEANWTKKKRIFSKWWFLIVILFLILVLPFAYATAWVKDSFAAPNPDGKEKIFVIKQNESIIAVATRLKNEGLIKDVNAFRIYTRLSCNGLKISDPSSWFKKYPSEKCLSGNIQAGTFKLSSSMDLPTLAISLTKGKLDSWIRILEGLRNEEIAEKLEKEYQINSADFLKIAEIGYMFPDTYLFKVNSTADEIAKKMRETFDLKFTAEIQDGIKKQGLSIEEGVILASIVERETRNIGNERNLVAGILLKRLNEGWKLEVDATVQFALGYNETEKTWWKKGLTEADLKIKSPYNTRVNAGLPPGPISNPGLSALKAIAFPEKSDYYFYLHAPDGKIYYGKTLAEHNLNKQKYLQ